MRRGLRRFLKPGMIAVDVGAGSGKVTRMIAQEVGSAGQVHAIEPEIACVEDLKRKVAQFPHVTLHPVAILHKSGSADIILGNRSYSLRTVARHYKCALSLYVVDKIPGSGYFKRRLNPVWSRLRLLAEQANSECNLEGPEYAAANPRADSRRVECVSLDDFVGANLKHVDFIYIDINGYEPHLLLGGFQTVRSHRPILWFKVCESQLRRAGFCAQYLLQWLKSLGYAPHKGNGSPISSFEFIEERAGTETQWAFDVICIPLPRKRAKASLGYTCFDQGEPVSSSEPISNDRASRAACPQETAGLSPSSAVDMKTLRYVFAHPASRITPQSWYEARVKRIRSWGYQVQGFRITPDPLGVLFWPEIDRRWKERDPNLLAMYDRLAENLDGSHVLINYGGVNLHPEFVDQLTTFNVCTIHDDPEASEGISRNLAHAFDLVLVANVGCLDMYRGWGVENVEFLPLGVYETDRDPNLTEEDILTGRREVPVVFVGSRDKYRDLWILPLLKEFPEAHVYGYGWPAGPLSSDGVIELYKKARIGWSMDQSVGPVTSRTFKIPANGILLIANNRAHLGSIYDLGKEAIGFDTLEECIEHTHYYLNHDEERRQIAAAGFRRTLRDYSEHKVWERMISEIQLRFS